MAYWFSLGHASVAVVVTHSIAEVSAQVDGGDGILSLIAAPGASLFAALVLRLSLVNSMLVYVGYLLILLVLTHFEGLSPRVAEVAYIVSSVIGGLGAGLMYVAEGVFFARSARDLASDTGISFREATAELAMVFAFWYLVFEALFKVIDAFLWTSVSPSGVYLIYSSVALLSVFMLGLVKVPEQGKAKDDVGLWKLSHVRSLWFESELWLLLVLTFTFGLCAGFVNAYITPVYLITLVGPDRMTLFTSFISLVALAGVQLLGRVTSKVAKIQVWYGGLLIFMATPVLMEAANASASVVLMAVAYMVFGAGRAIFESTNRAILADVFKDQSEAAFANQYATLSVGSLLGLFLATSWPLALVVLTTTMPLLGLMLMSLRRVHAVMQPVGP